MYPFFFVFSLLALLVLNLNEREGLGRQHQAQNIVKTSEHGTLWFHHANLMAYCTCQG